MNDEKDVRDETDIRVISRNAAAAEVKRLLATKELSEEVNAQIQKGAESRANEAVDSLIDSEQFQVKVEKTYKSEIRQLISKSESHANRMAGLAVAVFIIIFAAALSWQLSEARGKLSEVMIQHATAVDIISSLNSKVDDFERDINKRISTLDELMTNSSTEVQTHKDALDQTIEGINGELTTLKEELEEIAGKQEAITNRSTRTP